MAGHKRPERDDDPAILAETQQYLRDFNRIEAETTTPLELYEAMLALHPDRANPGHCGAGRRRRSLRTRSRSRRASVATQRGHEFSAQPATVTANPTRER